MSFHRIQRPLLQVSRRTTQSASLERYGLIRNFFLQEILIKLPREHTVLKQAKLDIFAAMEIVRDQKEYKQARLVVDVDPM